MPTIKKPKIPTKQEILEMRMYKKNKTYSTQKLCEKYQMAKSSVYDISVGKTYRDIPMPDQRKYLPLVEFLYGGKKKIGVKKHLCKKLPESDIWWVKECNPGFFYSYHHVNCPDPDIEKFKLYEIIMEAGYPYGLVFYSRKEGCLYVEVQDAPDIIQEEELRTKLSI